VSKTLGLALAFALTLGFAGHCPAGDRDAALALIEPVIKAHGGEELVKARIVVRTAKGVMTPVGVDVPFTIETAMHAPDQLRQSMDVGLVGGNLRVLLVINGDRGWRSSGGAAANLTNGEVDELREGAYVYWLTTLVPLRAKAFDLATLPETKINDKAAVGVKVMHKGRVDVQLYFDKQTHLLVKTQRLTREAGLAVTKETLFSDYKQFAGLQMPTRLLELTSGKKTAVLTGASYKFPAKLEDSTFAKP
jgi:hypothetical protein